MNPALRQAADRLLRPGTRSRAALGAIFDQVVVPLSGGSPPGLRRGGGAPAADVPVVLVLVLGADEVAAAAISRRVAEAQWATGGFTPVFVVDRPVLPVLRRAGYAVELLPPTADLSDLPERVVELRRTYATDTVLVVPVGGQEALDLGVLAGATRSLRHSVPLPRRLRGSLRRFEQWYDRDALG